MATPISAVSEIGVTRTRSEPKALRKGSSGVVAMFWPIRRTLSSRSISWWMASLIAPMYGISRAMSSSLGVDVLRRLFGLRIRTLDAEVDSRLHLPAGLLGDAVGVLGG